jgi:hypothetical protein
MLALAMIRGSWNDAQHHAPSKSRTSAAWLGECYRVAPRMEGASACVAAVASFGRRFSHHTAHHWAASDGPRESPTGGFRIPPGARRLFELARRNGSKDLWWRSLVRRGEELGLRYRDGSDGRGLSGSAVTVAPHNTCFTRRGATRRWPPRAR